jgi:hypothetical protein
LIFKVWYVDAKVDAEEQKGRKKERKERTKECTNCSIAIAIEGPNGATITTRIATAKVFDNSSV